MRLEELLKGKKMMIMTDMKVPVELTIKEIKNNSHYVETGPSNQANDWYPDGYYSTSYTIYFTNGASKSVDNLMGLDVYE